MLAPVRTGDAVGMRAEALAQVRRLPTEVWLLALVIAIGAVLRLVTISHQSYWLDEALAAKELHMSFGAMLSFIGRNEPNPPLFFVLVWPWAKVFGTTEAGLRSFSALAGTAVILIAYLCGRELASRRAGLLAAAFAAVSPFMIWYSQEAREYMLLTAFCGASFLCFAKVWREPSRRHLAWWTAFSALAVLTHYFAAFLVWPEAVAVLWRVRNRAAVLAVAVVAVAEATLLPHFISHASHPSTWIGAVPLATRIKQVPVAFGLGTIYNTSAISYGLIGAAVLAAIVIVLLIVGASNAELRGAGLAAAVAAAVLLIPLALAAVGRDYYIVRALIAAWIPLAVLVAAACTASGTRAAGAVVAAVLLVGFVWAGISIIDNVDYQRPNWRGVAAALGTSRSARAVIAYDGGYAATPIAYYLHGSLLDAFSTEPVAVGEIDVVGGAYQQNAATLPHGVRLLSRRRIDGYMAERFALASPVRLTPAQLAARAQALVVNPPARPAVVSAPGSA